MKCMFRHQDLQMFGIKLEKKLKWADVKITTDGTNEVFSSLDEIVL